MITQMEAMAMTTKEMTKTETTMLGMTAVQTTIKGADRNIAWDITYIIY